MLSLLLCYNCTLLNTVSPSNYIAFSKFFFFFSISGLSPVGISGVTPYKQKLEAHEDDDFNSILTPQSFFTPLVNRRGGGGEEEEGSGVHDIEIFNNHASINKNSNSNETNKKLSCTDSCIIDNCSDGFSERKRTIDQNKKKKNNIAENEYFSGDESTELQKQSLLASPSILLRDSSDEDDDDSGSHDDSEDNDGDDDDSANDDVDDDNDDNNENNKNIAKKNIIQKNNKNNSKKNENSFFCFNKNDDDKSNSKNIFDSTFDDDLKDQNVSTTSGLQFMSLLCVDEVIFFLDIFFNGYSFQWILFFIIIFLLQL